MPDQPHHAGQFKRTLSLFDAMSIVICTMIGSGIFIVSSQIAQDLQSGVLLLLAWVVAGVMTIIGALSYGELAACWPQVGGQYVYLKKLWGEPIAFLYGWASFLIIKTGSIAAVAIAFSKFLGILFPIINTVPPLFSLGGFTLSPQKIIAVFLIALLSCVNLKGIQPVARIQNAVTVSNVTALLAIIACGLFFGFNPQVLHANFAHRFPAFHSAPGSLLAMGTAMVGALFALDGWYNVTYIASEVKHPQKNLPLALLLGTGLVSLLYTLVNFVYLSVLPLPGIMAAKGGFVGAAFIRSILGPVGELVLTCVILVAVFGCINGMVLSGPRVLYTMAKDGVFFKNLSRLGEKSGVPENAVLCQAAWSIFLVLTGSFSDMLDYMIFASLLFYGLTVGGLFILRKKYPALSQARRAWGYPALPILYCLLCLFISISLLLRNPLFSLIGLLIVLSGVPVYFLWKKFSLPKHTFESSFTESI